MNNAACNVSDPFQVPDVVMKRLGLKEYLDMLRDRLNKGYMPTSSNRVSYNSKPEYVQTRDPAHPEFPNLPWSGHYETGCYAFNSWYIPGAKEDIFANVLIGAYQILTNLKTCQTLLRLACAVEGMEGNALHPWIEWQDHPDQTIAVDRIQLEHDIDIYL